MNAPEDCDNIEISVPLKWTLIFFFYQNLYPTETSAFKWKASFYFLADDSDTRFLSGEERHSRLSLALHLFRSCSVLTSRQGMCGRTMRPAVSQERGWAGALSGNDIVNDTGFICWLRFLNPWQGSSSCQGNSTDSLLFISGQLTASSPPPLPLHRNSKAVEDA